jgi:serine/threonine-protein kinase
MGRADLDHAYRSGLAWFVEPEMAELVLSGQPAPPVSFAAEQYALAALIYFLLCGEHHLTAGADREALYRQIVETEPPPFTRHGFEAWPEVEAVLARALARRPQDRHGSMAEFGAAFRRARPPEPDRQAAGFSLFAWRQKWVEEILNRTAYQPRPYEALFPQPPTASLYFGAAGLAWFLYRAAQVREEPGLLTAADLWLRQILQRSADPHSFESPEQAAQREAKNDPASLYLRRPGVHLVHALVSHSRGDLSSAARFTQAFIDAAQALGEQVESDVIFGRSGSLIGASLLLQAIGWSSRLETRPLQDFLLGEAGRVWSYLEEQPAIGDRRALPHLGVAHGWAGMLYAQLTACQALGLPPPQGIYDQLEQLARQAEPAGRGVSWLGTVQHVGQESETPGHAPGWCSGSAGHVYLWLLASEVYRQASFLQLAEKAAWHAWEQPDHFPNLCCGLAGRAFALLSYFRHTGETEWLARAQQLAWRACEPYQKKLEWGGRTLSLYRGALGPALLAIELERPERAVMPLFVPEGWPASSVRQPEDAKVSNP